ncbi:MAG: hypothetical protein H7343_10190 [Undibacterium sp.]|nr:hypothetical protein [Opitutaceae bacterium]
MSALPLPRPRRLSWSGFFMLSAAWCVVVTRPIPLIFAIVFLSGCSTYPVAPKPPKATALAPSGLSITQSGDAHAPTRAETKDDARTVQIPAGTLAEFNDRLGTLKLTFTAPGVLTQTVKTEHLEAPQAFTPPAPPTPSEISTGRAVLWYRIGVALGFAAGLFGLVRGWDFVMYGGGAVALACLICLFAESHPLLTGLIGAGAALAIAGPLVWHAKIKNLPAAV